MEEKENIKEEGSRPENPAPVIPAPETEVGEDTPEAKRDVHTGPGSKFQSSPPASVVPPSKKNSDIY